MWRTLNYANEKSRQFKVSSELIPQLISIVAYSWQRNLLFSFWNIRSKFWSCNYAFSGKCQLKSMVSTFNWFDCCVGVYSVTVCICMAGRVSQRESCCSKHQLPAGVLSKDCYERATPGRCISVRGSKIMNSVTEIQRLGRAEYINDCA